MEPLTDKQYKAALYEQNMADYEALRGTDCYTLMLDNDGNFKVFDSKKEIFKWVLRCIREQHEEVWVVDFLEHDPGNYTLYDAVEFWLSENYGSEPEYMGD